MLGCVTIASKSVREVPVSSVPVGCVIYVVSKAIAIDASRNYRVESTKMRNRWLISGLIALFIVCLAFSDHKRLLHLLGFPTTLVPAHSENSRVDQIDDVPLHYMEDDNHSDLRDRAE